jgi:hypothetical protein
MMREWRCFEGVMFSLSGDLAEMSTVERKGELELEADESSRSPPVVGAAV